MFLKKLWVVGAFFLTNVCYGMGGLGVHAQLALQEEAKRQAASQSGVSQSSQHFSSQVPDSGSGTGLPSRVNVSRAIAKGLIRDAGVPVFGSVERLSHPPLAQTESLKEDLRNFVLDCSPTEIQDIVTNWEGVRKGHGHEDISKVLLLVGPAGTGKSTVGKAIAGKCDMPYYFYQAPSFATSFKDSGTENLRAVFEQIVALKKPCVLIIDELEVLLKRHKNQSDVESGMLPQFWQLLDQYKNEPVLVVGTLNSAVGAPEAMVNRFDMEVVEINLPDKNLRKNIIEYHMKDLAKDKNAKKLIDVLANKTNGLSHRQLEIMVRKTRQKYTQACRAAVVEFEKSREKDSIKARSEEEIKEMEAAKKKIAEGVKKPTDSDYLQVVNRVKKSEKIFKKREDCCTKFTRFMKNWGLPFTSGVAVPFGLYFLNKWWQDSHFEKQTEQHKEAITLNKTQHAQNRAEHLYKHGNKEASRELSSNYWKWTPEQRAQNASSRHEYISKHANIKREAIDKLAAEFLAKSS